MIGAAALIGLSFVAYWMHGVYVRAPPTTPTHLNPATGNDANAGEGVGHMGELEDYDGDELQVIIVMSLSLSTHQ